MKPNLVRRGSFARSLLESERAWRARKEASVGADCVERKRSDERAESEASPKRADGDPIEDHQLHAQPFNRVFEFLG